MATQSSFYSGTALESRTFQSTKHIATKANMSIWILRIADNIWELMPIESYQLINNSCVLNELIDTTLYSSLEVRVADTPDELADSPTDIAIVASISNDVTTVANIKDEVVTASSVSNEIKTVSDNIDGTVSTDIPIVSNDIEAVKTVAENIGNGANSGGQFLGNSTLGSVMYSGQTTKEDLILVDGTNGLIVDSLTVEGDGSLEIQGNAVLVTV